MKALKHMGRRAFLHGAGTVAIGLPLLEYTHGHAFAAGVAKRFLTVFSHGGTISNQGTRGKHDGRGSNQGNDWWRPADPGESLVLGPIHEPLAAFRDKLLVLESVDNRAATGQDRYGRGGHGIANVTALTAADMTTIGSGDDASETALGPSIDHVLAERLAALSPVRFDRIHLNVRGHQYGSPYFRAARERVSGESDPRIAFDTIFAGVTPDTGPSPEFLRQQARRRSVVDGVMEGFARFRNVVSTRDLHVIDAHLEHLRALERELADVDLPAMCLPPDAPSTSRDTSQEIIGPLHVRIIVAALRCGLTNVANLEIADILTPWTEAGLRMDSGFGIGHSLGHYAREVGPTGENAGQLDDWLAEMLDNRRWRMSLVAQLLAGLDDPAFPEGDGTMLDNSLMLYTSEFSEPSGHISFNQPVLLAGSAGGYFRTGRHLDYNRAAAADPDTLSYDSEQSIHNLFTSILQAFGGTDERFGSAHAPRTGSLPGLV